MSEIKLNDQELLELKIELSSRQDAFKWKYISLGNLKTLTFYLLNMMSNGSYVFTRTFFCSVHVRFSMFGIRVEWKDTKRFTWFCVTQYFDSRFLIWYSWFDSLVTWSVWLTATEYQRKYSFHSRIDTVCNEIRRNNTVWIYKRIYRI